MFQRLQATCGGTAEAPVLRSFRSSGCYGPMGVAEPNVLAVPTEPRLEIGQLRLPSEPVVAAEPAVWIDPGLSARGLLDLFLAGLLVHCRSPRVVLLGPRRGVLLTTSRLGPSPSTGRRLISWKRPRWRSGLCG